MLDYKLQGKMKKKNASNLIFSYRIQRYKALKPHIISYFYLFGKLIFYHGPKINYKICIESISIYCISVQLFISIET